MFRGYKPTTGLLVAVPKSDDFRCVAYNALAFRRVI